jgi:hypothetical protein
MRAIGIFSAVAGFTIYVIAGATTASAAGLPPGAEAREAQLASKLNPQTRAWIEREAKREAAMNLASEAAASQAIRAATGVDFGSMSVEDAVMFLFMLISRDADADLRQMLADQKKITAEKQAERQKIEKQKASEASMKNKFRQEFAATRKAPKIARTQALDEYLNSQQVSYDSLGDMSEQQQLKMQMILDRRANAMQIISNLLKQTSDAKQGIIRNLK